MFDDYDFIMEALSDELSITNEFVSNAQARMLGNRAQQVNRNRNAAGLQGKSGSAKVPGVQTQPVSNNTSNQNVFNRLLSGIRPSNNAASNQTAKPVQPPAGAAPKPVPQASTSSTPAPASKPQPATTPTPAGATPKRKPMVYGSPEYNKTAKEFGIKDDSQKSTAELQAESKARMGRINDLVSQLHNKTAMQKKVEASQAHYNTLTNNGTQSVPAGATPTTRWSNNGDVNAAKTAATAQRSEIFNTKPAATPAPTASSTPATASTSTTSTTPSAPQPKQNIVKEK